MLRPYLRTFSLNISLVVWLPFAALAADFTFTPVDVPGAALTAAVGINKVGQIVGQYADGDSPDTVHGFLLSGGHRSTIDVPAEWGSTTSASGINRLGQ